MFALNSNKQLIQFNHKGTIKTNNKEYYDKILWDSLKVEFLKKENEIFAFYPVYNISYHIADVYVAKINGCMYITLNGDAHIFSQMIYEYANILWENKDFAGTLISEEAWGNNLYVRMCVIFKYFDNEQRIFILYTDNHNELNCICWEKSVYPINVKSCMIYDFLYYEDLDIFIYVTQDGIYKINNFANSFEDTIEIVGEIKICNKLYIRKIFCCYMHEKYSDNNLFYIDENFDIYFLDGTNNRDYKINNSNINIIDFQSSLCEDGGEDSVIMSMLSDTGIAYTKQWYILENINDFLHNFFDSCNEIFIGIGSTFSQWEYKNPKIKRYLD